MKQFVWNYGKRNIITYPRLKYKIFKIQFMTIRMNVIEDTTNLVSDFGFYLNKEQFGLI